MRRIWCMLALFAIFPGFLAANQEITLRFYQGVTAYVYNPSGKKFEVQLEVRDWNLLENGPREMLFKIYEPDGQTVVREVIEDDGVSGSQYGPETGGWDHEMWYYAMLYGRGSRPMLRWSSFTDPRRIKALPVRRFVRRVTSGKKGIYRILMVGSRDHLATLSIKPRLKFALAGHPIWLHGHGDMFRRSFVYVPRGTIGIHLAFAEFDQPITRHFRITILPVTSSGMARPTAAFKKLKSG